MTFLPNSRPTSLFDSHPREFAANRYVYPVLGRRARGISIGVNLSLDKRCDFDCVYCQVDRAQRDRAERLDAGRLAEELDRAIELVRSGRLFEGPRFQNTPAALRRLNDIALSGDGEPTLCPDFAAAAAVCVEARRRWALDDVKLVLITNASRLDDPAVQAGVETLAENHGEIWGKLDAGTEGYYHRVNRSEVSLERILSNLAEAARRWPLVIQTLWMRIDGQTPPEEEVAAYVERLREIGAGGGRIEGVQLHTIARRPAEPWVAALTCEELEAIGREVRAGTGLAVETFS